MVSARPYAALLRHSRRGGLAFAAGFCMMTIELMAGRLTAPYLGSSLHTWTAAIAAVMAGIAIGAYVGGRLADGRRKGPLLGPVFITSGVSVALSLVIAGVLGPLLASSAWPLQVLTGLFALAVFFLPAFFLAMVTPILLSRNLDDLGETGGIYGSLGAWNAIGSILGTYLTGFVFIAYAGTRLVFFMLAGLLVLTGVLMTWRETRKKSV